MAGRFKKHEVISRDGTLIYYETHAAKPGRPWVLLVHGIGGDTDGWQFVRDYLLHEGWGAVSMDVRGHGYSGHPARAKDYAAERIDEDILTVMQAEKLRKPILVGHSGGAILAAQFASRHQDALSGLILIAGSDRPPAYLSSRAARLLANGIMRLGALISPPPMRRWHSPYPPGKFHKEVEAYGLARTIFYNSLRSYLHLSRVLVNIDLRRELEVISIPTLIIAGEQDGIFPLAVSKDMHQRIKGSRLAVLPDTNHVSILNNPQSVAYAMLDFFAFLTEKR